MEEKLIQNFEQPSTGYKFSLPGTIARKND